MKETSQRRLNVHLAHIKPNNRGSHSDVIVHNPTVSSLPLSLLLYGTPTTVAIALTLVYVWIKVPSNAKIRYNRPVTFTDVIKAYIRLLTKVPQSTPLSKLIHEFPDIEVRAPIRADREHLEHYISQLPAREDMKDDAILPPFYLNALTGSLQILVMAHPKFPIRMLGAVNVSNEIKIHIPVQRQWLENGELSAVCHIGEARLARRGIEFDIITDVYRKDQLVWSLTFSSLQFMKEVNDKTIQQHPKFTVDLSGECSTYSLQLSRDAGRIYGKMGYDINPIHMSDIGAKMFGFPRVMAHGMWVVAQAEACSKRNELVDRDSPQLIQVSFKKPTLLPTTVKISIYKNENKGFVIEREDEGRNYIVIEGLVKRL